MQERTVRVYVGTSLLWTVGVLGVVWFIEKESGVTTGRWSSMLSIGFFALWVYSAWFIHRVCRKIDAAGDVFEEILADSMLASEKRTSPEHWKKRLPHASTEGMLGRLESHFMESVHILGQRELSNKQEQAYLKRMMTDISHQIKTPLASLRVFLEIFEKSYQEQPSDEKLVQMAVLAEAQTDRIHHLVTSLLRLTQLESGMLVPKRERHSLQPLLQECVQNVVGGFSDRELQIELHGAGDVVIECDKEWMQEALQNILKNACEYSPRQGVVDVRWNDTQMAVTIQITDQGEGIAPEELPRIFNRFYRVHRAKEDGRKPEGVGIGLALAREIIERQHGTIVAYSSIKQPTYTRFEIVLMKEGWENLTKL